MKIIILAFIISISLHLLFLKKYKNDELAKNNSNNELVEKKSDVKFVKIKKQEIAEAKIEPVEKTVEIKKNEPVKKEIKETKPLVKNIEKKVERKKEVNFEEAKKLQDNLLKEQIVKNENSLQEKTLENFLSQKEPVNKEILTELEKLYGEEYQTFTKVQKAYLEKNLNNFQVITQRVLDRLGYPKLAAKLKIGGINIVEFMFHPDGSITDLKIINSSSYAVLDEYTLELIEIAYKDYPKPTTTTKLRFKVFYRLF